MQEVIGGGWILPEWEHPVLNPCQTVGGKPLSFGKILKVLNSALLIVASGSISIA